MKMLKNKNQSGFTLIEAIVVIGAHGNSGCGLKSWAWSKAFKIIFSRVKRPICLRKPRLRWRESNKELIDVYGHIFYFLPHRVDYTRPYSPPSCQLIGRMSVSYSNAKQHNSSSGNQSGTSSQGFD